MADFQYYDAAEGEDDDHLIAVYKMSDGSLERVPKKDQSQFEKDHAGEQALLARLQAIEKRLAALEARNPNPGPPGN